MGRFKFNLQIYYFNEHEWNVPSKAVTFLNVCSLYSSKTSYPPDLLDLKLGTATVLLPHS